MDFLPGGHVDMEIPKYFIFVCASARQSAYKEVLDNCKYLLKLVDNPEDALTACVQVPPIAIIIDMVTGMRAGNNNTSLQVLYNLELAWPVLRSTSKKGQPINVISTSPQNTAPFQEGLEAIVKQDPTWVVVDTSRHFIRQERLCRAKFKLENHTDWTLTTITSISSGGCFMINYSPPSLETKMTVVIQDLGDHLHCVEGTVSWIRHWDEGPKFPGIALTFKPSSIPESLPAALSQFILEK